MNRPALSLHPKVSAALLASWVTTIVVYALKGGWGIEPPVEVGLAFLGLATFVCGWLAPSDTPPPAAPVPALPAVEQPDV